MNLYLYLYCCYAQRTYKKAFAFPLKRIWTILAKTDMAMLAFAVLRVFTLNIAM